MTISGLRAGMVSALAIDEALENEVAPCGENESEASYMRRSYAHKREFWNREKPELGAVEERSLPTRYGEVPCRFYYGGDADSPVIFYLHGGGFVVGNLDTHDRIMRLHAHSGHCNVIGINYSKSPEHKCPRAVHELLDVLAFCYDGAAALGLNCDRFCLAGDSAGAHLSLAAMLDLRDSDSPIKIACSLLYYGAYGLMDSASARRYGSDEYGLSRETMLFYKHSYLTSPEQAYEPSFNLLMHAMHGLPPMLILGIAMDPLIDDSLALAEKVGAAGGIYKYSQYDGVLHGFMHYSTILPDSYLAIAEGLAFLWSYVRHYDEIAPKI